MNCYLDFEANSISQAQEIISIGAILDNGKKFYSLVKPHYNLSPRIEEMTGITQEEIDLVSSIDVVIDNFFKWIDIFGIDKFFVFGHCDKEYINASIVMTENKLTAARLRLIRDNMVDLSPLIAKKFGCQHISLRKAYHAVNNFKDTKYHNALEDAKMLKKIWEAK